MENGVKNEQLIEILKKAREEKVSDIHVTPECPVMFRIDGTLQPQSDGKMKAEVVEEMVHDLLEEDQWQKLQEEGQIQTAVFLEGFSRIRVSVFRQRGNYAMALRILSYKIPTTQELGIPDSIVELMEHKKGLVLITGANGMGKSTMMASLIAHIAESGIRNIITLESPIEYMHSQEHSIVIQREIGSDSRSYAEALKATFWQDPDVIMIGDLRDPEVIEDAIHSAETGHLVLAIIHANDGIKALQQLVEEFPKEKRHAICMKLAEVLEGVVARRLMPHAKGGRVSAYEVLLNQKETRRLLQEGQFGQLEHMLDETPLKGMRQMDASLFELYMKSMITAQTAVLYAKDPEGMEQKLKM